MTVSTVLVALWLNESLIAKVIVTNIQIALQSKRVAKLLMKMQNVTSIIKGLTLQPAQYVDSILRAPGRPFG